MKEKGFGLALGGGAARGFAHIGLIKFLEEEGVKIKEVAGTSMGSIIAACLAVGMNGEEMKKVAKEINYFSLIDFDFKKGLIKGKKIEEKLFKIFGNKKIEELKISLKIVSADIGTGEKFTFENGKIKDAIRASISIPGILAPYEYKGKNLVDGGILNNLPIEVLESKNVIASSVLRDLGRKINFKTNLFGIEFDRWVFRNSYEILQKTIDIMMKQNEERSISCGKNVKLVNPKFDGIDYWQFNKWEEIVQIGYDFSKENLKLN